MKQKQNHFFKIFFNNQYINFRQKKLKKGIFCQGDSGVCIRINIQSRFIVMYPLITGMHGV